LVFHIEGATKLRVLENRVPWGIFGPKWDEVTRERIKLHNEIFNDPYSSPNFSVDQLEKNETGRAWTGLIWLRIGTGGGLLW
jgi:hypothetical protein